MSYEKKIRYLEYWENGEKVRSVGFVKMEIMDMLCNMQIQVTGLHSSENCVREVRFRRAEKEDVFGSIAIQNGRGILMKKKISADRLCEGIGCDELESIRIGLGKSREVVCRWREDPMAEPVEAEASAPQPEPAAPTIAEAPQPEPAEQPQPELRVADIASVEPVMTVTPPSLPRVQESKWKQLAEIYPHISPFHDERDYLSIGPGDFVILPQKYYRLINNSFLLHGFYNYGHLILAKAMKRGEEVFYLGVPGNFYEKERQAAIMFGFESFECKVEPAQNGAYGYFMIRVEL